MYCCSTWLTPVLGLPVMVSAENAVASQRLDSVSSRPVKQVLRKVTEADPQVLLAKIGAGP